MKLYFKFLFLILILCSCEGENGISGIIIDSKTGERLPNVNVIIEASNWNSEEAISDPFGYFEIMNFIDCSSFADTNCNEITLEFEKSEYKVKVIDESYFQSSEAEFIPEGTMNTIIIKLRPNY